VTLAIYENNSKYPKVNDIWMGDMYTPSRLPHLQALINLITHALKQMSYYYGINFTWGFYAGLASYQDKKEEILHMLPSIYDVP
jgi:hypothetical protein